MKRFLVMLAVSVPILARAHEMEGGSTSGLFGLKPEYLHVLLNPLPGYGLLVGLAVLIAGFAFKQSALRTTGVIIVAICTAAAWPVLYFGQHGYNNLYPQLDTESAQWLDTHMSRAERFIYVFYLTAGLAVAALACLKKFPRFARALSLITLLATFACMGVGAWISRAGGEVSHSEFRVEGVSPETPASGHSHSMPHGADHDNASTNSESAPHAHPAEPAEQVHPSHADEPHTNPTPIPSPEAHHHADSATNSAPHATTKAPPAAHEHANTPAAVVTNTASPHQHPAATATNSNPSVALHQHNHPSDAASAAPHSTNAPVASSERTPDTPEAIWTELRQRHELFARAIKGKDTAQIHANAVAIQKLANALVSVVHPDYKVAVQKGADQIIAGARGAHRSAHADDQAAVESNFKLFEQSLEQLEQKMKKQ